MKNILVVSPNWLGDVVFSTPVYRSLKEAYPQARIVALAVPRVKEILQMCPFVDDVLTYDEKGEDRSLVRKIALVRTLALNHFDAAFILRPSFSRTLLLWLAGIPKRTGFVPKGVRGLLTHTVPEEDFTMLHRSDVYLKAVEVFGVPVGNRSCTLDLSEDITRTAREFLEARGVKDAPYIVLNTGGNWDLKQWPKEHFALLTKRIVQELKISVVLPGAKKDEERVAWIAKESGVNPVAIAGETCLTRLMAIAKEAAVFVSSDSGPLHLANAVGGKVLGLFGPTHPEITGPRGQAQAQTLLNDVGCNKAPCYFLECPDNQCLKQLSVDQVLEEIKRLL